MSFRNVEKLVEVGTAWDVGRKEVNVDVQKQCEELEDLKGG